MAFTLNDYDEQALAAQEAGEQRSWPVPPIRGMTKTLNDSPDVACWLTSAERSRLALTLATGDGVVTLQAGDGQRAYASVEQLRAGDKPGKLVRSSAVVMVEASDGVRFLLVTDNGSEEPGKWRFPAVYLRPKELPLIAAQRAVADQFELSFGGKAGSWRELAIKVGGELVTLLGDYEVNEFRARSALVGNTVEFYYPMQLAVVDADKVSVVDRQGRERQARLFTPAELFHLSQSRNVSAAARAVLGQAIADGALSFVRTELPA